MFRIFGETISFELVIAMQAIVLICLLALKLRTIIFLTLIVLILPGMDTPLYGISKLLRWAFLVGLMAKGVTSGLTRGFRPDPLTKPHRIIIVMSLCFSY